MKTDIHLTDLNPDEHEAIIHAMDNMEWKEMVKLEAQAAYDRVQLEGSNAHLEFYSLLTKIGTNANGEK